MKSYLFLTIFTFLILLNCQPSSKSNILAPEIRYMADTMFAGRKNATAIYMDSICTLKKAQWIQHDIDSLLEVEYLRINELIER